MAGGAQAKEAVGAGAMHGLAEETHEQQVEAASTPGLQEFSRRCCAGRISCATVVGFADHKAQREPEAVGVAG
jgi:hypothetical protein